MPTGGFVPGARLAQGIGSVQLTGAVLALPSVASWVLAGLLDGGASAALADPRPVAFLKSGGPAPGYGLVVFDRIHVIPRSIDLGAVVSQQHIEVEVWNAFLSRAKRLDEITVLGPPGVSVVDPLGTPAWFAPFRSEIYAVEILVEGGAATIDNLVTWVFVGIDPLGTDLELVGFRLLPFPFPANLIDPIVERFGYLTDVLTAWNGNEQRIGLRAVPIGSIEFSVLFTDRREAQMAQSLLVGNQARPFGVPRWQFRTPSTLLATAGDLEVRCEPAYLPFEAGGLVLLWRDPFTWEAQPIDDVETDRLVLSQPLRSTWPAGTAVIPLLVARLSPSEAFQWEGLAVGSQSLSFDVDGFRP